MAASKAAKASIPENLITVSPDVAKHLYELYRNVESADTIFQSCQSTQFRQHVKATYTAKNVSAAFEALKTEIDRLENA